MISKNKIFKFKNFYPYNPVICSSMIIEKEILIKNNLKFPTIKDAEDYALWFCISSKYKIGYINAPLLQYYNYNPQSIRPNNLPFVALRNKVIENFKEWKRSDNRLIYIFLLLCLKYFDIVEKKFFENILSFIKRGGRFLKRKILCRK